MHKITLYIFCTLFFLLTIVFLPTLHAEEATNSSKKIYLFEIKEEIAPPIWRKTHKALAEAKEMDVSAILIDMNTYGGMVADADSIRTAILNCSIPVYVFINNNAASAGALISISCDSIYMKPGGNIGASTVVNQSGEKMPDKYQSYMRAMMRATAETKGRDPKIAEAMVDESIVIEGIIEEGKVLTFTSKEARSHGFCEGEFENIQQVIEYLGYEPDTVIRQKITAIDQIIGFLIHPMVSGVLIMLMIGGIYFELQSPGVGFALLAAIFGAVLYFAPLYLEGLAAHWEILIFIIGVGLLLVEIFAIPGFGIAGISGITLVVVGLSLSMVESFELKTIDNRIFDKLIKSFFMVVFSATLSIIGSIFLGNKLLASKRFSHIVLKKTQDKELGYISSTHKYTEMIGKQGVTQTPLRPSGKIEIDNELFDAYSDAKFIEKGVSVKVIKYQNTQLIVRED
ncbi:MAG: serine protease [Bacteroidetes bacterium]|nr:MAG: serine protease [Bacteroidota bacterium]